MRHCKVPAGKFVFFPLVNFVASPDGASAVSCADVTNDAYWLTQGAKNLVVELDGFRMMDVEEARQASIGCFDLGARTKPRIKIYPSASNGYYAMLRPLARGRHTLNFGGQLRAISQAVTYELEVE